MFGLAAAVASALALAAPAAAAEGAYRTGHESWRAADAGFASWRLDGVARSGGRLRLPAGRTSGTAVSPVVGAAFGVREVIPSWNAATPRGTWLEARIRARVGGRWSRWYELGSWSSTAAARRHSARSQEDAQGRIATDTLQLARDADALQLGLRLGSPRAGATPTVSLAALAFSAARTNAPLAPRLAARARLLDVPRYSQMVYPDGGQVWCSPTSLSMVLAYWQRYRGPAEPRVRRTVRGVYDRVYRGHGNWPFNTAYAATERLQAQVARFGSMRDVERWIDAGVPVVVSFAWRRGELAGAGGASAGHLAVVVGFDGSGNPVVNDPAARSDAAVRRTYPRAQLERLWLRHSGGTVYLVHPPGRSVPALT